MVGRETDLSRLLDGLNEAQRQAVTHVEGPLLVLAGPGSGKTRVITHRIAYMIEQAGSTPRGFWPSPSPIKPPTRCGIGSSGWCPADRCLPARSIDCAPGSCAGLLPSWGFDSDFSILDPSEVGSLVKGVMKQLNLDVVQTPPDSVARRISSLKNDLVPPGVFAEQAADYFDRMVAEVYPNVVETMRSQNIVDFDDLLVLTARLLRENPEVRARLDRQYEYVLVDEYQDTNVAQYAIARGLSVDHPNLCATGDPDQSVYSWRGANLSNILHSKRTFQGRRWFRLEQNYRSTANILAVADHLIRHNIHRKHKDLRTDNDAGSLCGSCVIGRYFRGAVPGGPCS